MKLDQILIRENNNIDLLRLMASISVIYFHGYFLSPEEDAVDFISKILKQDNLGSLAVKFFFFISGLCVCNSLMEGKNIRFFLISRFFRIIPAYFFVVIFSALLIGPVVTNITLAEYFTNYQTYDYIISNIMFNTKFSLPGVFEKNPFASGINGSLWTIVYEIGAYLGLLSLYMIGIYRSKLMAFFISIIIIIDLTQGHHFIFTWRVANPEIDYLVASFVFGAILAIFKKEVDVDAILIVGLLLLYYLLYKSKQSIFIFYSLIFLLMLLISIQPWFLKLRPRYDLSYGVYLWGFPIQQLIVYGFPDIGVYFNILISIIISIFVAWISWVFIEKKAINYGKNIL